MSAAKLDPALCRQLASALHIGPLSLASRDRSVIAAQLFAAANLAERYAALESELATLRASVIAALSSAGPEVAEDERTA